MEGLVVLVFSIFILIASIIFSTFSTLNGFSVVASIATAFSSLGTLILLFFTYKNLNLTKESLDEMKEKRKLEEEPVISVKVKPKHKNSHLLYFVIQNTGGGPAYDVSFEFEPNINYFENIDLNDLEIFRRIPVIDKNESIEFFFNTSTEFLESDEPKKTKAIITYYKNSKEMSSNRKIITREIDVLFNQRKSTLQVNERGLDDLVKEITDLRQGLLLLLWEIQDNKSINKEENNNEK